MPLPPLKTDPKFGYFGRWPEDGDAWLHPDDVAMARRLIPSQRVFRRDGKSGEYALFHYGEATLRARPALWQEVRPADLEIGDWVEVLTHGLANEARTGRIAEMLWNERLDQIEYQIVEIDRLVETLYARGDLKRVEPTPRLDT